jgi:catechol 2,3-dioxygenase-like lactoylglutathione lyase family enzyme
MIGTALVAPTIGVSDLAKATAFYGGVLGLQVLTESPYMVIYQSGANSKLEIYQTEFAGTNKATYATWEVGDIEAEVEALQAAGISFEHYDMPGLTREGDVHVMGDSKEKAAWFKDPDGNILCLHQ